jgi:hypothetical protein
VLRGFGAGRGVVDELLRYSENCFVPPSGGMPRSFPLDDLPQIEAWRDYLAEASAGGVFPCLARKLVQLRFPIRDGMSRDPEYLRATRRGEWPATDQEGLRLDAPGELTLELYSTACGRVPILTTRNRSDFVRLLRALAHRNEPVPIADSQGASLVTGLNNWDRVGRYRAAWEAKVGGSVAAAGWPAEMERMAARKELYQDQIVLLSRGPYSDLPAAKVGMTEQDWLDASLVIRREHECVHLFTKRVFQSARNNLMDELIADYGGIVAANGRYRADWFLLFLGIEDGRHHERGRLQNYRGEPPISAAALAVLCRVVECAARTLERFDHSPRAAPRGPAGVAAMIVALATLTLEELAGDDGETLLGDAIGTGFHTSEGKAAPG